MVQFGVGGRGNTQPIKLVTQLGDIIVWRNKKIISHFLCLISLGKKFKHLGLRYSYVFAKKICNNSRSYKRKPWCNFSFVMRIICSRIEKKIRRNLKINKYFTMGMWRFINGWAVWSQSSLNSIILTKYFWVTNTLFIKLSYAQHRK